MITGAGGLEASRLDPGRALGHLGEVELGAPERIRQRLVGPAARQPELLRAAHSRSSPSAGSCRRAEVTGAPAAPGVDRRMRERYAVLQASTHHGGTAAQAGSAPASLGQ